MRTHRARWSAFALAAGWLGAVGAASAQSPGGYSPQQGLSTALYGGPTSSSFLNPYLMQMGPGNPDYLTYMYMANQSGGGIGSGVISGTRPAPGAPAGSAPTAQPGSPSRQGQGRGQVQGPPASNSSAYPQPPRPEYNRVTMPLIAPGPGVNSGGFFTRGANADGGAGHYFSRTIPVRSRGRIPGR